jgi:hypothetical protein
MGVLFGPGAMLAVGEPAGKPAGEVVGMGIIAVGAVVQDQAEAGAVELVGSVDGGAPDALSALLGSDEALTEGRVVAGEEGGHPGEGVAVEGIAAAGDAEALVGVVVARLIQDSIKADVGPDRSAGLT